MDRPHRESRQHNGIMLRRTAQPTFATKSAQSGPKLGAEQCPLLGVEQTSAFHLNGEWPRKAAIGKAASLLLPSGPILRQLQVLHPVLVRNQDRYFRRQQDRLGRSTENEFQPLRMRVASHDQEVVVSLVDLLA